MELWNTLFISLFIFWRSRGNHFHLIKVSFRRWRLVRARWHWENGFQPRKWVAQCIRYCGAEVHYLPKMKKCSILGQPAVLNQLGCFVIVIVCCGVLWTAICFLGVWAAGFNLFDRYRVVTIIIVANDFVGVWVWARLKELFVVLGHMPMLLGMVRGVCFFWLGCIWFV